MSGLCPGCGRREIDEDRDDGLCRVCGIYVDVNLDGPMEADTPMGLDDDGGASFDDGEPTDIDSDAGFDVYAGGPESDGYDTGNFFDDFGCDDF